MGVRRLGGGKRACAALVVVGALVVGGGATPAAAETSYFGSAARLVLNRPIVDLAATPSGNGYWLVASDGGLFSYGDAAFYGSTGNIKLNKPIVGMAATPTGRGYWLVAEDGGMFSFGDARFHGSTGAIKLAQPIVGMAATPTGRGYWLVASDGGVFSFGDALFYGSTGGIRLASPIVGLAGGPGGRGYWMVAEDGGIFAFGSARFLGSAASAPPQPVVDIAPSPGGGYWIATQFGAVHVATESGTFVVDPNLAGRSPAETIAIELVARINAERRARGLAPLSWDTQLAQTADAWARNLASTNTFTHQNIAGVLNAYNGRFSFMSENLFSGTGAAADSGTAHLALMRSDGHRSTLLTPELQFVGIGAVCAGGKLYVVEDFAVAMGSPTPPSRPTPSLTPIVSADDAGTRCF